MVQEMQQQERVVVVEGEESEVQGRSMSEKELCDLWGLSHGPKRQRAAQPVDLCSPKRQGTAQPVDLCSPESVASSSRAH